MSEFLGGLFGGREVPGPIRQDEIASGKAGKELFQEYVVETLARRVGMAEGNVPRSDGYMEPSYEKTANRKTMLEKLQHLLFIRKRKS